jgi:hypothetical protein
MKPKQRSLTGLLLAIVLVPVIVGLIACLPVPLGDSEKSRIDPELSGVWLRQSDDTVVVLFEPWDKRSWLLTTYELDFTKCEAPAIEFGEDDLPGYAEVVTEFRALGPDCVTGEISEIYRAWNAELGGQRFMTWQPKGVFDETHGFEPEYWFGLRVEKASSDELTLRVIDIESPVFEEERIAALLDKLDDQGLPRDPKLLKSARSAVEKVIRRNVDDDALYEANPVLFYRVKPEDYDLFVDGVVLEP